MKAAYQSALANLGLAKWNLSKTRIYAPTNGSITNLQTHTGNYAIAGIPLGILIDTDSFYMMGYFEETKLQYIREGNQAKIILYNGNIPLRGQSIGRAIYDQSVDTGDDLLIDVKPKVPWVRLAQQCFLCLCFNRLYHRYPASL
jgi:multidrug resistance efflux pump